jgi:hypothetical protein
MQIATYYCTTLVVLIVMGALEGSQISTISCNVLDHNQDIKPKISPKAEVSTIKLPYLPCSEQSGVVINIYP